MSERRKLNYPAFPAPGLDISHPLSGINERQYYKAAIIPALIAAQERFASQQQMVSEAGNLADLMIAEDEEHAKK